MQTQYLKPLFFGVLAVLALTYAVLMFQGVQDYAEQAFTPEQMLKGQVPAHIPVWIEGTLEHLQTEQGEQKHTYFQVAQAANSIFVLSPQALSGDVSNGQSIAVLGRKPHNCLPNTPDCRMELRAVLPAGSIMKYLSMGGYGFFVWISYILASIILLVNFMQPKWREREIKNGLSRKQRRRQT